MKVYVFTVDPDGALSRSRIDDTWIENTRTEDPKAACMFAVAKYLKYYTEDFGCDYRKAEIEVYGSSVRLILSDETDPEGGEDAVMYFSADAVAWENVA
jgi:hypothetical protein